MTIPTVEPDEFRRTLEAIRTALGRVIVGQAEVVERLLVAFFAGGHVLLEGVPGLGKTLLAKSFARTLGLSFKRIQCTPDLMPADILGTQLVVDRDGRKLFEFAKGPVFTHILLADEINRATPKTQSALLEAMGEHQVTVAGTTFPLEEPFFVIATQNPIEMEGSLPLNETVLVSGRLTRGTQLLAEARQRGTPIFGDGDRAVYDLPGLWTWALSPHGRLERQPCQAYVMPYQGRLVRLKTKTGREIQVTAEHPFLVNEGGEIRWKPAKELRAGDYLVTPTSLPQPEARRELMSHEEVMGRLARRYRVVRHEELLDIATRSERFHHLERLGAGDLDALRIASRLTRKQLAQRLRLSRADYWQLVRFLQRRTANARIKSRLARYFSAHPVDVSQVKDFVESSTITSLNRFAVTPEVAAWLGFVLSDGTVGRGTVAAYQKNHPRALDAFIQTTEQQLGVPIRGIRSCKGMRTVSVGSKPLVDYLRLRFGLTRSGVIPSWMLSLPEVLRRPFLRTFIGLESHCDTIRRRITFIQKRRQAVNVVMSMLLLEGIVAWARKRPDVFELKIQGEDFQAFLDRIGWVGHQRPVAARPETSHGRLPSGYRPHDYSPFRVVPVPRQDLTRICEWLGINSFHRAKDRKALATRSWYQAYRFGRRTGIVSQAKLRHLVSDIKQEVAVRQSLDLETMASRDPWAAARLCGLSLIDVAQGACTSRHQVWKTYRAPDDAVNPAVAGYITQQFTNRIREVERCLHRLERLSQMGYDQIEQITTRSYAGPVFGLVVPTHQNYLAGFGACGISHNTFPLPEAQLDRFLFKIFVGYPSSAELSRIIRETTSADAAEIAAVLPPERAQAWILGARRLVREVLVARPLEEYVVRLVTATRPDLDGADPADGGLARRFLRYGASPRGAQAILMGAKVLALMDGRVNVSVEDVDAVLLPALIHRVVLSFEAEADKRTAPEILTELTAPIRKIALGSGLRAVGASPSPPGPTRAGAGEP